MQPMESEKTRISRRVRIRPNAKVYGGETGVATMVTGELSFYVSITRPDMNVGLWFDFSELEFL